MTTTPPAENQTKDQAAPIEAGLEVAAHAFWEKNRQTILIACAILLVAVIGREGWFYYAAQHEASIREDFARAADRPEQLAAFASANAGHALAGVAYLQIADGKYTAGDFRGALENYNKAVAALKNPGLLARARVGAAMSQVNSGDKAAGEAGLKAVQADATLPKGARAEAGYHLATIALDAGNSQEVGRLASEIGKIDAGSIWSQRASLLLVGQAPAQ